jgi:hypothetical protein
MESDKKQDRARDEKVTIALESEQAGAAYARGYRSGIWDAASILILSLSVFLVFGSIIPYSKE